MAGLKFAEELKERYRTQFSDKAFIRSVLSSLGLILIGLVVNFFAGTYATERASSAVSDIVLSNIPVFDVDLIFVYGPIIFWIIISAILVYDPKKIPFTLKSVGLFIIIRSIFITLTHIGPFPDAIAVDSLSLGKNINLFIFNSGADLFFSGHTGLPFLLALIFWKDHLMRVFCLSSSVFFGIVVLLGHLHYSIDVMSAFFISYTIFHIALKAFPRDRQRQLRS